MAEESEQRHVAALVPEAPDASEMPIPGTPATVGRGPRNEIVLDDDSISDVHARFEFRDGGWWVADLGSTNGTRLNGERLGAQEDARPVEDGASVQFGGVRTSFRASSGREPEPAAVPASDPGEAEERRPMRIPVWVVVLLVLLIAIVTVVLLNRPAVGAEIIISLELASYVDFLEP